MWNDWTCFLKSSLLSQHYKKVKINSLNMLNTLINPHKHIFGDSQVWTKPKTHWNTSWMVALYMNFLSDFYILYLFIYSFVQLLISFSYLLCTRPGTGIQKGKNFKKPLQKIVSGVVTWLIHKQFMKHLFLVDSVALMMSRFC